MDLLIKIINITLQRNDRNILDDVSLDIHAKSFLNIYGANGSGKTSFLKVIHTTSSMNYNTLNVN